MERWFPRFAVPTSSAARSPRPRRPPRWPPGCARAAIAATELPLADGGEGTLDVLLAERPAASRRGSPGPLGDPVDADWGLLPDGTAVIEMARASGLALVERNDPLRADTRGVGELLLAARAHGATRAIVTLGGRRAPTAGSARSRRSAGRCTGSEVVCACDVETRFVDAARVFGPQKGATPEQTSQMLTERLRALEAATAPRSAGRRRRGRARRRPCRARRHAALRLRRRRRSGRPARAARRTPTSSSPARASSTRRASTARSSAACCA